MKTITIAVAVVWCLLASLAAGITAAQANVTSAKNYSKLPANTWILIHREDKSGGKTFARAILAENVDRIYLWGTGGEKPARNVYRHYELESLDPKIPRWLPAFPQVMRGKWTAENFPPFRIYGQSGPDGSPGHTGINVYGQGHVICYNRIQRFSDSAAIYNFGPPVDDVMKHCVNIDFYNNDLSWAQGAGPGLLRTRPETYVLRPKTVSVTFPVCKT